MRNMSFAITTGQMQRQTKTVTRRVGWRFLIPGDLIQPIKKGMGLRRGEAIERIGDPIRILSVSREPLLRMLDDLDYGFEEVAREGFKDDRLYGFPSTFVQMFCATHAGCTPDTEVTRIEFAFTGPPCL